MPEHYYMVCSPSQHDDLMKGRARHTWYHQRHVERWERRYRKPYPHITMSVGSWSGMTIRYDKPSPEHAQP